MNLPVTHIRYHEAAEAELLDEIGYLCGERKTTTDA
jgi:hypothetical protein